MEKKFKPRYYLIYLSTLLGPLTTNSLIPIYQDLRVNFQLPEVAFVSLAITIYILPFAILQLFAGTFSDIVDKKRVVIYGFFIFIAGLSLNLVSVLLGNYILFLLAFFVQGIGFSFINPTVLAIIGIIAPDKRKGFLMGLYNSSAGLGITIGGILSGFFANIIGNWRLLFLFNFLIGILSLITFIYALRSCETLVCRSFEVIIPKSPQQNSQPSKLKATLQQLRRSLNKEILLLGLIGFFCFITTISLVNVLNEQLKFSLPNLNAQELRGNVSLILTITGISSILMSPITGMMLKKVNPILMLTIGGILLSFFIIMPLGTSFVSFLLMSLIIYMGSIFMWPALFQVAMDLNPEARGTNSAIINSMRFTGYALVGPLYLFLGIPALYLLVFSLNIVLIGITLFLNKKKNVD